MARLYRGNIYEYVLRDFDRALACYQEVDSLYPGTVYQAFAWGDIASIYDWRGDKTAAKNLFLRSIQAFPGLSHVWLIGDRFWRAGDYQAATYALETYLANSSEPANRSWVNYLLGLSYGNLGSWPNAIASLNRAVATATNGEEASWSLYQLALAQKASGDVSAARATLQSLVSWYPAEFPAIRAKGLSW